MHVVGADGWQTGKSADVKNVTIRDCRGAGRSQNYLGDSSTVQSAQYEYPIRVNRWSGGPVR